MPSHGTQVEQLTANIHRTVLGLLLTLFGMIGIGFAQGLRTGRLLVGLVGLLVGVAAFYFVVALFAEAFVDG